MHKPLLEREHTEAEDLLQGALGTRPHGKDHRAWALPHRVHGKRPYNKEPKARGR